MPKNIVNLTIPAPGTLGLNTQEENTQLSNAWATKAENCVFDDTGRLSSRKGWQYSHATAVSGSPDIEQLHEYIDNTGQTLTIFAANSKLYKIVSGTITEITGTITTPTANNWKFVNFNGKCIGFQSGHSPIVLATVGGSFADISLSGTQQPTTAANEVMAAFGRAWCLDGTDLKYSDSLDETAWNGVFDLSTVWLAGIDTPVALAEFNGHLVIFGKTSIVVYNNPWNPTGGGTLDTSQMSLVENIAGVGCIARDSVQNIGSDIVFLSNKGVRSLGRTIQEKSMPLLDLSVPVNDDLIYDVNQENVNNIRSVFAQQDGFYLLSLPTIDKVYYFDLRSQTAQGTYRIATWTATLNSMLSKQSGEVCFGLAGYIGEYSGYLDGVASDGSGGSTYKMSYHSTWTDLGEQVSQFIKLAKKFQCLVYGGRGQVMTVKWAFDYLDSFNSTNKTITGTTEISEWNIFEWGTGEWGGGDLFYKIKSALSNSGRVLKIGLDIDVNGSQVSIQQITLQAKLGRIA